MKFRDELLTHRFLWIQIILLLLTKFKNICFRFSHVVCTTFFRAVHSYTVFTYQPVAVQLGVVVQPTAMWARRWIEVNSKTLFLGCRFRFPLAHFKNWLLQENNCSSADKWPRAMDRPCPRLCPQRSIVNMPWDGPLAARTPHHTPDHRLRSVVSLSFSISSWKSQLSNCGEPKTEAKHWRIKSILYGNERSMHLPDINRGYSMEFH